MQYQDYINIPPKRNIQNNLRESREGLFLINQFSHSISIHFDPYPFRSDEWVWMYPNFNFHPPL